MIIEIKAEEINLEDNTFKSKFNEEILKSVLRGAGLSVEDSFLATNSFKIAYPPEMLTESSYLILPFAEGKLDSFAINIDGKDAVLITKVNNNFKTFITSTQYAHLAVEKGLEYFVDNTNLLEIETIFKKKLLIIVI